MRIEIELNPNEVKAAIGIYLAQRGLTVSSVDVSHASGAPIPIGVEHNYDRDRLMLNVIIEVPDNTPKQERVLRGWII